MTVNTNGIPSIKIIVVGVVRNCAMTLERDFNNFSSIIGSKNVFFVLIESDSSDGTVEILEKISKDNKNVIYESLGKLEFLIPSRLERLAYCRNRYLDRIRTEPFADYDYVLVADFDGVNKQITKKSLYSCWDRTDWSVCAANQIGPYYDIFALRKDKWVTKDCFQNYKELLNEGKSHAYAFYKSVVSKMFMKRGTAWIEVGSAFGGMAVYRKNELLRYSYTCYDESGKKQCEHVSTHKKIIESGGHIFINTKMINSYLTSNVLRSILKLFLLSIFGEKYFKYFKKDIYPD